MKIAYIAATAMTIRYVLLDHLLALQRAGAEVLAICAPGPHVSAVREAGVPVQTVAMHRGISPLVDIASLARLTRLLRRERPHLVHTHTPKAGLLGQYAAVLAGVPRRVHTVHGLYLPPFSARARWFFRMVERATLMPVDRALVVSEEDIPVLADMGFAQRVEYVGNGIDTARFGAEAVPDEAVQALRQELRLRGEHPVVGIVARVNREKGYPQFFQAAARVARRLPSVRFLVVGPVEYDKRDALDPLTLAREAGVVGQTIYVGERADVPVLYRLMDVAVLPSFREGMSGVLMEAAASGVPAVTTNVRGCRQVVGHGETGLVVEPGDVAGLAGAILELLLHPERSSAMGRAAQRRARSHFEQSEVITRVLACYQSICPAGDLHASI